MHRRMARQLGAFGHMRRRHTAALSSAVLVGGHLAWMAAFRLGNAESLWGPLLATPLVSAMLTLRGDRARSYAANAATSSAVLTLVLGGRVAVGGDGLFDSRWEYEALPTALFATAGAGSFALAALGLRGLGDARVLRRPALCAAVCWGAITWLPLLASNSGPGVVMLLAGTVTPIMAALLASMPRATSGGWSSRYIANAGAGAAAVGLAGATAGTWDLDQPAALLFVQTYSLLAAIAVLGAAALLLAARSIQITFSGSAPEGGHRGT